MDRLLFAGLQILSVLSFTADASSSRPHIIFILADDLVSTTDSSTPTWSQTESPGSAELFLSLEGKTGKNSICFRVLRLPSFLNFNLRLFCIGLFICIFITKSHFHVNFHVFI